MKKYPLLIGLSFVMIFLLTSSPFINHCNAQKVEMAYLDDETLWTKGYQAFQSKDYSRAALYLYAYAQRYPDILDVDTQDKLELYQVLNHITANLVVAAETRGDDITCDCDYRKLGREYYSFPISLSREKITGTSPTGHYQPPPNNNERTTDPKVILHQTIRIGGKTWLAENLNIPVSDSWCYDDNPKNCRKFGRLYTWYAAEKACRSLGPDWHLPSKREWEGLINHYGGIFSENVLRTLATGGESGFNATKGGIRDSYGYYRDRNDYAHYWTSTPSKADGLYYAFFPDPDNRSWSSNIWEPDWGQYCRCVKK